MMKRSKLTLTDLPTPAIDEILSRLPVKNAARTSVLSRAWRHRWQSIPKLTIDNGLSSRIISQILLLHLGPLRLFSLEYYSPSGPGPIYTWLCTISLRSKPTLQSLTLRTPNNILSINSIAGYFPNLTRIDLTYCPCVSLVPDHSFSGFPNLKTLNLGLINSCSHLSRLISRCPMLQALRILKVDVSGHHLDIVGPNLRDVELCEIFPDRFSISSSTPLLESLLVVSCRNYGGWTSDFLTVFGDAAASSVKNMELDSWILKAWTDSMIRTEGRVPSRFPFCFYNLRRFTLRVCHVSLKLLPLTLCVLRSAPNLRELKIKGCNYDEEEEPIRFESYLWGTIRFEQDIWETQKHIDLFEQLETLSMYWITGKKTELDFIEFVLAKARILKTVLVKFSPCARKKLAMTKLLEFPRTSNQARILLTDVDEDEMEGLEESE